MRWNDATERIWIQLENEESLVPEWRDKIAELLAIGLSVERVKHSFDECFSECQVSEALLTELAISGVFRVEVEAAQERIINSFPPSIYTNPRVLIQEFTNLFHEAKILTGKDSLTFRFNLLKELSKHSDGLNGTKKGNNGSMDGDQDIDTGPVLTKDIGVLREEYDAVNNESKKRKNRNKVNCVETDEDGDPYT